MKLLIEANLSPRVAEALRSAALEAVHVVDLDLLAATDDEIFDRAAEEGFVVVTADSDFGTLLAVRRAASRRWCTFAMSPSSRRMRTSRCWSRTFRSLPTTSNVVPSSR